MLEVIRGLVPSIVRTVTPWLIGLGLSLLLKVGIEWKPSPEVFVFVSGAISTLFYAAVRWLETRFSTKWGWLLGSATPPVYVVPSEEAVKPLAAGESNPPVEIVPESSTYAIDPEAGTGEDLTSFLEAEAQRYGFVNPSFEDDEPEVVADNESR